MTQQRTRTAFKGPEGRYVLAGERLTGLISFSPHRATRLTLAQLSPDSASHNYVCFNVGDFLHICVAGATDKEPVRSIYVNAPGNALTGLPTCHDHCFAPDGFDLLIGLSTGDVVIASLQAQLQQPQSNTKLVSMLHFNGEGVTDGSKCTAAKWVPGSDGSEFVTAHASGNVYVFHKGFSTTSDSGRFSLKVGAASAGRAPAATIPTGGGGVSGLALSPDGRQLAAACRDGMLRVFDLAAGVMVAGFKSYHGALLCCAWSPDGRYIAAGGEDDLVAIFSCCQGRCTVWGEAHNSWVASVAWDKWRCPGGDEEMADAESGSVGGPAPPDLYRLASVGQDCQLALWEVDTEAELVSALPATPCSSVRMSFDDSSIGHLDSAFASPRSTGSPNGSVVAMAASASIGRGSGSELRRGGAGAIPGKGLLPPAASTVAVAVPRAEMQMMTPITAHKLHMEPMSDVLFTADAIYTACQCGQVKCWQRPQPVAQQQQQLDHMQTKHSSAGP